MSSPDMRDLIGIPFCDRGRDMNGSDCWGLFKIVQKRYGNDIPDVDVSAYSSKDISEEVSKRICQWEKVGQPKPGDAVAMSLDPNYPDAVQHFGVYIGNGKFIHTLEKIGSICVPLTHPFWKNKIRGFYRWAGQ